METWKPLFSDRTDHTEISLEVTMKKIYPSFGVSKPAKPLEKIVIELLVENQTENKI